MKKLIISTTLIMCFCLNFNTVFSQSIITNDTIRLECLLNPVDDEFIFDELDIRNNSSKPYDFKIRKVIGAGDTVLGTETFFCDDVCYGQGTYVSTQKKNIGANATFTSFSHHYKPNGKPGTSMVKYEIFNVNNSADKVYVVFKVTAKASPANVPSGTFIVNLDFLSSVKELNAKNELVISPNPADNKILVAFTNTNLSKLNLKMYDLLGNIVAQEAIPAGAENSNINTSQLANGVYYLNLEQDNKIQSTKKIIISH